MTRLLRRQPADEGSIMLSMVLSFAGVAVTMVLIAGIMTGQSNSRNDERFLTSVQGADAGVQEASLQLSQLATTSTSTSLSGSSTIDGVDYAWTATRPSLSSHEWTLTSTGTVVQGNETTERTVTAKYAQGTLFPLAAFADSSINFNGNNAAGSYPTPGRGFVGTNGVLDLKNNSAVDGVYLFDFAADPNWSTRCFGTNPCATAKQNESSEPLTIGSAALDGGFIKEQIDLCKSSAPLQPFVGASIAGRADPYCFSSFHADTQNFVVTGSGSARVFVEGDVTLGNKNHSVVNAPSTTPEAALLQIYSLGLNVNMYNQSDMGAAIYAPNATCSGVTSNAASTFYGALICDVIDNVGGWTFMYDTRLSTLGDGVYDVSEYNEP